VILCYIDESGTSQVPGNSSHYILAGLSIPIENWKDCDKEINTIKGNFNLSEAEIHTAWLLRGYREQSQIPNFSSLSQRYRRSEVEQLRRAELLRLQSIGDSKRYQRVKKNFRQTEPYIHLTLAERTAFVEKIAETIGGWGFVRVFAECVDKVFFDPRLATQSVDEQAFEQVVSRFEQYLNATRTDRDKPNYGLLIHDNNPTVAKRHTQLMKGFHKAGTLWVTISNIIDTPLFVSSELTSMVQLADVCSYSLRRYFEKAETKLFREIMKRADRRYGKIVGVRHYSRKNCGCEICQSHHAATT